MNTLPSAGADEWYLPRHAHVVVHETEGEGLITIYGCGAAQRPPSAQVIGHLVRVDADHESIQQVTGYIAKLREWATLERQAEDHWVIRATGEPPPVAGRR
ncbi:MAG: hypothetical protein ABEH61_05260 [Haloarculaceae archaeon]